MTEPPIPLIPAILRFLGHNPVQASLDLPGRLRAYRRQHGLSIRAAAERLGVDEGSWSHWETTGRVVQRRHQEKLSILLGELARTLVEQSSG